VNAATCNYKALLNTLRGSSTKYCPTTTDYCPGLMVLFLVDYYSLLGGSLAVGGLGEAPLADALANTSSGHRSLHTLISLYILVVPGDKLYRDKVFTAADDVHPNF